MLLLNLQLENNIGKVEQRNDVIVNFALLRRQSLEVFLELEFPQKKVIDCKPYFKKGLTNCMEIDLGRFWKRCEERAKQNKHFISAWKERDYLIELGNLILKEFRS